MSLTVGKSPDLTVDITDENRETIAITSSLLNDFSDVKDNYKLSNQEFKDAIEFAMLITEGKSKSQAYDIVFNSSGSMSKNVVNSYSSRYIARKYVSAIIDRLITGNHILLADRHLAALNELYLIGTDFSVSPKVRVEALSKFVDVTKRPDKIKDNITVNVNVGADMLANLEEQLKMMASNAKLITRSGSIVDAEVIRNGK